MSKLEELKALLAKSATAKAVYVAAPDSYDAFISDALAGRELFLAAPELLPQLIAIAEAAKAVHERWESTDWKAEPTAGFMNKLRDALNEITKDADK